MKAVGKRVWSGFIRLRTGTSEYCEYGDDISNFIKDGDFLSS
jgi:hypothetical protein